MRIIKVVVVLVFCLAMSSGAMASGVAEVVSGPALSFVETELDLGDITSDSELIVAEKNR